jgi:integrase
MGETDDFDRFLEARLRDWKAKREERHSRTILQMWDDWIGGSPDRRRTRDAWFRRWLEVRFELSDKIVSLGQLSYSELTTGALNCWLVAVARTPGKKGRAICAGTVDQIRAGLQAMFTHYLKAGEIEKNPLRDTEAVPRTQGWDRRRQGFLTQDQVELIASKMPLVSGFVAKHLYYTACRLNNIRLLRKDKVDLVASELVLIVKGGGQKRVPVGARTIAEMKRLIELSPGPFVYPSVYRPTTDAIAITTLRKHLRRACTDPAVNLTHVAGERVTFHHFRHGRARDVLSRTKDITQVKTLLTHSDIRTTQRYLGEDLIRAQLHRTIKDD